MVAPEVDGDAIETAIARGHELLKTGDLVEAQQVLRTALATDSSNPRVLVLLGLTCFRAGQFEPAREVYELLTAQAPNDASHRLNLGLTYLKLGDAVRAVQALETSRSLDPSQGRAVGYLGLAYARAGQYADAYRAFVLAGQPDLAAEIAQNIPTAERDSVLGQFGRLNATARPAMAPGIAAGGPPTPNLEPDSAVSAPAANGASQPQATESGRASRGLESGRAVPRQRVSRSRISAALRIATPSVASVPAAVRGAGGVPAIALSQLAIDTLVRPDEGTDVFETSGNGMLVIHVVDRLYTRLDGVHVTGGELAFTPTLRRSRGRQTAEDFAYGGSQVHAVSGRGWLIAAPGKQTFTAVTLDDDILYLREDLVFAFAAQLRWENGYVPGLRGKLPLVQFRGDGAVALRCERPLMRVKLPAQDVVHVDAEQFAGWIGRVIPRAIPAATGQRTSSPAETRIECTGEGIVLVDPLSTRTASA